MRSRGKRLIAAILVICLMMPHCTTVALAENLDDRMNAYVAARYKQLEESGALMFQNNRDAIVYRNVVRQFYEGDDVMANLRQAIAQIGYMEAEVYDDVSIYVELLLQFTQYAQMDMMSVEEQLEEDTKGYNKVKSYIRTAMGFVGFEASLQNYWGAKEAAKTAAKQTALEKWLLQDINKLQDPDWLLTEEFIKNALKEDIGVLIDIGSRLVVQHYCNVYTSLELLKRIRDASTTSPDLTKAAEILIDVYGQWLTKLESMDFSSMTDEELQDASRLPAEMNYYVQDALVTQYAMTQINQAVFSVIFGSLYSSAASAFDIAYGLADSMYGVNSIYLHMKKMTCISQLDSVLISMGFGEGEAVPWRIQRSMLENYLLRLRLTMLGEEHLYQMVTSDAGATIDIYALTQGTDAQKNADYWITNQKAMLQLAYDSVVQCIADIDAYYLEQQGESVDLDDMLARSDVMTETISGTVVYDDYYALQDDPSKPDLERPHPMAGQSVADALVELVRMDNNAIQLVTLCSTRTDANGAYSLVYPQAWNREYHLSLRISAKDSEVKTIPALQKVRLSFRSAFNSSMAQQLTGIIHESDADTSLQMTFPYSERFFLEEPSQYNHQLARLSLGMAVSAYSSPESDRYWNADGEYGRENNIRSAYRALGFGDDEYYHYDVNLNDSSSKVAFSIASRQIADPSIPETQDQKVRVIAVVIRGGGYGSEWADNFYVEELSDPGKHHGFNTAAQEVVTQLESYIQRVCAGEKFRIWITGYSRGAAVANLAAGMIDSRSFLRGEGMYAYTFATPSGTKTPAAASSESGIFNIVYGEDMVPMLALKEWGFGRNGETLTFSMDHSSLTAEQADNVQSMFSRITMFSGSGYHPGNYHANSAALTKLRKNLEFIAPSSSTYDAMQRIVRAIVHFFTLRFCDPQTGENVTDMAHRSAYAQQTLNPKMIKLITKTVNEGIKEELLAQLFLPHVFRYTEDFAQAVMSVVMLWCAAEDDHKLSAKSAALTVERVLVFLSQIILAIVETPDVLNFLTMETNVSTDSLAFAHNAEVYMAWMLSLDGETLFGLDEPALFDATLLFQEREKPAVNGKVFLNRVNRNCRLDEGLDVDGDGIEEAAFFGKFDHADCWVVAFFDQDSEDTMPACQSAKLCLGPGATLSNGNGRSIGRYADGLEIDDIEYNSLSLLTGEDGALYACAEGCFFGANGWPESFPEFFVSETGQGEMKPVDIEYHSFLLNRIDDMIFMDFPFIFGAAYVEELERWCLVMKQASEEEYGDMDHRILKSCFSINEGVLQLEARFVDDVRVE